MKILDKTIFYSELEWLEALQKAEGYVNERIISFCDHNRLANNPKITTTELDSVVNFLTKIFSDFSVYLEVEDIMDIKKHFLKVQKPNYYSIKNYIITNLQKNERTI